jgi:hypothetical protein
MDNFSFLSSARKLFVYYKSLGDKSFAQVVDEDINWRPNAESNSIALIVHHLSGNMLSRFTDFLTSDGEKDWRNRDAEFEVGYDSRSAMIEAWEKGWSKLFEAIDQLSEKDLEKTIYIRNEGHSVMEAIQRQLAHYPYHVGQIVYIAKSRAAEGFQSLSIPKGNSQAFNADKFSKEKAVRHFTDEQGRNVK